MRSRITIALALAFATQARAEGTGHLAPELRLDGEAAGGACTFVARSGAATVESATGAAIEVPGGDYELRVECKSGEAVLVPAVGPVTVTPGKTTQPKIEVRGARLRIEARRNGVMLPAKVHLFAAGQGPGSTAKGPSIEARPLVDLPANQKFVVAQGRYDVFVELDDPRSPRAEVLLPNVSVAGPGVTALEADLSDGGLILSATMNGKPARATIRAFPPGSLKEAGVIDGGEEIRLPAGRYSVATELQETADFTTRRRDLWIRAGQVQRRTEAFEAGELNVAVVRDAKPVDATVLLSLPGAADFFNHFAAPDTVTLTPGSYDVSVTVPALGSLKVPAKAGVKVTRGQRAKIVFDVTPASLVVRVTKRDQPIEAEVHVRAAGGGDEVAPADANGVFRLWSGRYEVVAKLASGEELLDGPFEVKLGERVERKIAVVRSELTVVAHRGKSVIADAEILVFRPGATRTAARGLSGARLELVPGVYDVKVVAGSEVAWREGVRVRAPLALDVDLGAQGANDEPLPEGELGPPGDDVPEGDTPASADGGVASARDAGAAP